MTPATARPPASERPAPGAEAGIPDTGTRDLRSLLAEALPGVPLPPGLTGLAVTAVADDSRAVRRGALFTAVPGSSRDGAAFAEDAVRRGAAAVIAARPLRLPVPVVTVDDVRAAAADLAAAFHGHPARALDMVGITGTNGKTTAAYLLHAVLASAGRTGGLFGTVEYRVGERRLPAPNTTPGPVALQSHLAEIRGGGGDHALLEVSSHALVQQRTRGIPFVVAVFTNLTGDHLDYHGTMEAYRDAKGLLFAGLAVGATACLNDRDPASRVYASLGRGRVRKYGFGPDVEVGAEDLRSGPDGVEFVLRIDGKRAPVRSPLLGRHNAENLLAAAAGAHGLGLPVDVIAPGLRSLPGVPGRLERVDDGSPGFRVVVDYAHTEDALRRVLGNLRPVTPGRVLVLGGCGGDRDRTKRPRMARAMVELADEAVFTSDNPRSEDPLAILREMAAGVPATAAFTVIPDRREAIGEIVRRARPGDTVLIAGKGHETYQVLRSGTVPFDDREEARRALRGGSG